MHAFVNIFKSITNKIQAWQSRSSRFSSHRLETAAILVIVNMGIKTYI